KILVAEGTEQVPVNKPIALLLEEGETAPFASPQDREGAVPSDAGEGARAPIDSPPPSPQLSRHRGEGDGRASARVEQAAAEKVMDEIAAQIRGNGRERVFASPLARRLARERGIDIQTINGSGPYGRIVQADIERAAARTSQGEQPRTAEPPRGSQQELVRRQEVPAAHGMSDSQVLALYAPDSYELVPLDTMRKFIAERLTLSKQTIPHFYLAIDCELDAMLAARARLNSMAPQDG